MTQLGAAQAIINKIQTTADGGARVTLDLNAQDYRIIQRLVELKLSGRELVGIAFAEIE